jgi:hypothetical protein
MSKRILKQAIGSRIRGTKNRNGDEDQVDEDTGEKPAEETVRTGGTQETRSNPNAQSLSDYTTSAQPSSAEKSKPIRQFNQHRAGCGHYEGIDQ